MTSRRGFLAAFGVLGAHAADKPLVTTQTEARRFRDPATEFDLTRLTDPSKAGAWLPRQPLRALSSRSNTLAYSSDRTGEMQAFRLDLKSGESRQLTRATALDPATLSLLPDDKGVVYFDEDRLMLRERAVYTVESGWHHTSTFAVADDAQSAAFVEQRDGRFRLRVVALRGGSANTLIEANQPVTYPRLRPKRPGVLYNNAGAVWLVNPDGRGSHRLKTAEGTVGEAQWSADGRRVHYLLDPGERRAIQLREINVDDGGDKLIGPTTRFISFSRNSDSSVFAGVSASAGSPFLLLLLRAMRRELAIAEHKASDPSKAAIVFSPDSQKVYWQTDREGRSAIYTMALERFIEKTEDTQ